MSIAKDALAALKNIIQIQDKVEQLAHDVQVLYGVCDDLKERMARLEGKFELLERMASSRRRLPRSE